MIWEFKDYWITDEKGKVDSARIIELLSDTYWAQERSPETIVKSLEKSICFSVFKNDLQIAFARVVTDESTFAWIGDVVVDAGYRKQGIGKKLMEIIHKYPPIYSTQQVLGTRDAHGLYEKYGFVRTEYMRNVNEK